MEITTFTIHFLLTWCMLCPVRSISTTAHDSMSTTERPDDGIFDDYLCSSVKDCGTEQQNTNITTVRENYGPVEIMHEYGIDVVALCKSVLFCHLDKRMWWITKLNKNMVNLTNICGIFDTCLDIFGIPVSKLSFFVILEAVPVLNITRPMMKNDTSLPYMLPMDLIDLCPYTSYCGVNASAKPTTRMVPCCFKCSCDRNCGLVKSCCYDELDVYKMFKCIDSRSTSPLTILQSIKYSMVNRCLKNDGSTDSKICNDTTIRPVSSTDTRLIYVNPECALCNGVTYFTQWEAMIVCNETTTLTSSTYFLHKLTRACDYKYIPAEMDMEWTNQYICDDNKVIGTCFEGYTNEYVQTACKHIRSPYTSFTTTYANVYCALCSNIYYMPKDLPKLCLTTTTKGIVHTSSLSILMDSSVIDDNVLNVKVEGQMSDDECLTYTVPYPTKPGCRPLLCPEGMVRIMGSCQHFAKQLINLKSSIQILLTPVDNTTVSTSLLTSLLAKIEELYQRPLPLAAWITHECPFGNYSSPEIKYTFSDVYMLPGKEENISWVQEVVVKVFTLYTDVVPRNMINEISRCLLQQWSIYQDNIAYPFTSRLYTYTNFVPNSTVLQSEKSDPSKKHWPKDNNTYTRISTDIVSRPDINLYITKLYFCDQVELDADEITAYKREIVINHNGVVLGDNEYTKEHVDDDINNYIVKVCVQDYMVGLNRNDAKSNEFQLVPLFALVRLFLVHLSRFV